MRVIALLALLFALALALASIIVPGHAHDTPPTIVIRNVTVIPGTGGTSLPNHTVVVEGERIRTVAPAASVEVPRDAQVVDGHGRFLIPGLIDMHAHLSKARASALGLFVTHGVTTVRDMGGDHQELLRWRQEVREGERTGPRIILAGPFLESKQEGERDDVWRHDSPRMIVSEEGHDQHT